jgi:hypothetical protein
MDLARVRSGTERDRPDAVRGEDRAQALGEFARRDDPALACRAVRIDDGVAALLRPRIDAEDSRRLQRGLRLSANSISIPPVCG